MELEKIRQERLSILLASPHQVVSQDIDLLKDLVQQFPFFEPLQLLLAKLGDNDAASLTTAALHTNGLLLHKIINQTAAVTTPPFDFNEDQTSNTQNGGAEVEQPVIANEDITDALVMESITSSDFFAFEQKFSGENVKHAEQLEEFGKSSLEVQNETTVNTNADQNLNTNNTTSGEDPVSVSNYNDDTLPYTFLWWLAKTRKEHQTIFQPYATVKTNKGGELQQQYVEHIFHIQSPFNAEEVINNVPTGKHIDPKETEIIDSFLKKDPQINPPKPEQIDNENKAKKSAEDHNDLVSETLAKIYIEQMLYHKAIETYQKLILKFPEKSRYFADLIQSLEKKI